jgi:hypothetical protein
MEEDKLKKYRIMERKPFRCHVCGEPANLEDPSDYFIKKYPKGIPMPMNTNVCDKHFKEKKAKQDKYDWMVLAFLIFTIACILVIGRTFS